VTQRLIAHGCTAATIAATPVPVLEGLVRPVGFYRNKARFLQATAARLAAERGGDIPDTVAGLVELPGVGPKVAHVAMTAAWDRPVGIGVDTHVHRIAHRLGWVGEDAREPEDTRVALEAWLPRDLWGHVNLMLVGFGQTRCKPLAPLCNGCLNAAICPSSTARGGSGGGDGGGGGGGGGSGGGGGLER
jgi:endonuclease III